MDGAADATAAALGAWASVRGFFTPATLFLVVNLVIGTIALTSRSHQRRRRGTAHDDAQHHQEQQLFHQVQHQEDQYYDHDQQHHHHEQQDVPPPPAPAPLARTSSVLDRLRSIGLYRFSSGDFPPEYAAAPATDSRDVTFSPSPAGGDAHYERSRLEPAPMREQRRRPAPSRMNKSSSSEARKAEVAPAPAARLVRAILLEEDDAIEEYARADELTASNLEQQQPPALQHEVEEEEEHYYREEYVPPLRPAPLDRAPSVLERLRSFGLSRFRSGDFPPEYAAAPATDSRDVTFSPSPAGGDGNYERSRSEPAPMREHRRRPAPSRMKKPSSSEARKAEVAPAPAARVVRAALLEEDDAVEEYARADEFTASNLEQQQQQPPALQHEVEEEEEHYYREEYVPPPRPAPLDRAPSVLERLRSFSLSRFRSGDLAHENAAGAVAELESNHTQKQAAQYSRSRSEPGREQTKKGKKQLQQGTEPKMSKSTSEARKPAAAEEAEAEAEEEGGVDARADDFINSFRKQLKLQRLNSLLNYKEMLNRGA